MSLHQFQCFHGMYCSPSTAQKCIQCFVTRNEKSHTSKQRPEGSSTNSVAGGSILFLPSEHTDNEIHLYECYRTLNICSYYALVLASFTGLSTILGLTKVICSEEYSQGRKIASGSISQTLPQHNDVDDPKNQDECSEASLQYVQDYKLLLRSETDPSIHVRDSVLEYVHKHILAEHMHVEKENSSIIHLVLKRKFEYNFRLIGLNVIMLHIISYIDCPTSTHKNKTLHLVEVYRFRNPGTRFICGLLFRTLSNICRIVTREKYHKEKLS